MRGAVFSRIAERVRGTVALLEEPQSLVKAPLITN